MSYEYENENEQLNRSGRKEKRRKKVKTRNIVLIIVSIIIVAAGIYGYNFVKNYFNLVDNLESVDGEEAVVVNNLSEEPFTVLITGVGTNGYDGEAPIADAIMVAAVNPKTKSVDLVSVPRDNYLPRGAACESAVGLYDKVTHMGANIGCLESTLEDVFDIEINYYVSVNFVGFVDIINALGGVEMHVPDLREGFNNYQGSAADGTYLSSELQDGIQWCEHGSNRSPYSVCFTEFGPQTVDGEHALALSRSRHYDSDFARSNRQNEMIKAIMNKATSPSGLLSMNKLLEAVNGNVSTNIPQNQFLDFANLAKSLTSNSDGQSLQIRSTQLQGLSGSFDGEVSGYASYNAVPVPSIENIRMKFASTLDGTIFIDESAFNFDEVNYQSEYAPYFGGDYLGIDVPLSEVKSYRSTEQPQQV